MWMGSVHSPFFLVFLLIALANLVLVLLVGTWWFLSRRRHDFPHRAFAGWLVLLVAAVASYFPRDQHYAAVAVLLFGPGQNSAKLQKDAALGDSTALLNAFILRGAQIDDTLLCFAAYNDSPAVINRLIERGAKVNDQHYPSRITPLHNAVEGKQHQSAAILLRAGARTDVPNAKGITPLALAMSLGDERMVQLLKATR